jgi:two-component system chemotaxis sensor kinase CheA
MQDGLDEEFWQEYGAESEEHLDTAERLLAQPPEAAGIAALFRAFHSLKGMSAALGVAGMAQVAHRCEDLLGLARQGRLTITPPVAEGLLAAVDALRGQRATVLHSRADAPPPPWPEAAPRPPPWHWPKRPRGCASPGWRRPWRPSAPGSRCHCWAACAGSSMR